MHTLQDAKNKFSAVVKAALAGEPQEVSRRGKPAVVVVAAADYARLVAAAQSATPDKTLIEHLMAIPQGPEDTDAQDLFPRQRWDLHEIDL